MNVSTISGWVQAAPEIRVTRGQQKIINFEIAVEGDRGPYVPIAYILRGEGVPALPAGTKVHVCGALMHHRGRGLFVAATSIRVLDSDGVTEPAERLTQ